MGLSTSRNDINVTPLIDVLLVLLVIFLVVMPVMMRMETVDVPRTDEGAVLPDPPIIVKVNADLTVAIDDGAPLVAADLPARLRAIHPKLVFVAFEDGVPWNEVIATVDSVRGATDGATVALKTK